jgi:hypothetical protein
LFTTSVGLATVTVAPPTGELALGADNVTLVGGDEVAARCVTETDDPAIVIVPVRSAVPVLAATVNCTVPLPVPLAPCEIVTNVDPLAAVHEQVDAAVTVTLPVPPSGGKAATLGCPTENVQLVEGFVGVDLSLQAPTINAVARLAHRARELLDWCIMRNKIHRDSGQ